MTAESAGRRLVPDAVGLPFPDASSRVAWATLVALGALFLMTATDALGLGAVWENAHWTVCIIGASLLAYIAYRRASARERTARGGIVIGMGLYLLGQVAWDLQVLLNVVTVPAVSDVFFLSSAVPITWGIAHAMRQWISPADRIAFTIDATTFVALLMLGVFIAFGSQALITDDPLAGAILLLYPVAFLGAAAVAALGALVVGVAPAWLGIGALIAGLALTGLAWVFWMLQAITELPAVGSPVNYLFSVGVFVAGVGAGRLRLDRRAGPRLASIAATVMFFFPMVAALCALSIPTVVHHLGLGFAEGFAEAGAALVVALALARQSVLLAERRRAVAREHALFTAEEGAREAAEAALVAQQTSEARYRHVVEVFGHLSEQLSFAAEEDVLIRGGVAALRRLVASEIGDLLLANASQDRLVVAATWGPSTLNLGDAAYGLPPVRCLGIRRGSVYAVRNASDELMLPCPAHPIERGSLLCVPMLALGQTIGVVHLEASEINAFGVDDEGQAARVAEQVALAIANARMLRTMESMALTDPLTRLHNARFFDPFLDREISAAQREGEAVGVIMIDLDHFKEFNDTHGHPAGDEALKVFARAALTVLRDSDTLARYGGEEFVVAVRDADLDATAVVAERLRLAVEHSSVEVGLGRYANFTASFGVAATTLHGSDRLMLLKAADRALYRAKRLGRNQVSVAGVPRVNERTKASGGEEAVDRARSRSSRASAPADRLKRASPA